MAGMALVPKNECPTAMLWLSAHNYLRKKEGKRNAEKFTI